MSVVTAGRAPVSFEIKSANLPLVALLLKSTDLTQLASDWAERFADIPDFFDHDPLVIDLSHLLPEANSLDFKALLKLLRQTQLSPIAVKGGNEALMAQAVKAGLTPAPESVAVATPQPETIVQEVVREVVTEVIREVPAASGAPLSAMVIDKPLRSGQQVYAKGRDLIVLSMVNPGAEVIADGHIHVYAPLRGKVIAGARGNAQARIFAQSLEAELISIAGVYRTSDVPLPPEVHAKATHIWLEGGTDNGKLMMEPFKS
jgi:septum site-determining protein MinC